MVISRVSTFGIHQTTIQNAVRIQNDLFDTQSQISSGVKADNFEGLDGQVEIVTALDNSMAKASRFIQNNKVLQSRMTSTSDALSQLIEIANNTKNLILQRRNVANAPSIAFDQQITSAYSAVADRLNATADGRYLFGGAKTDTPPVDTDFPTLVEVGVPDNGYYQGSTQDITSRIQDNFSITTNVRADDEGFQKIVAAIATARKGHAQSDDTLLADAYDLLQDGINRLITVQADVGAKAGLVDQANERHESQNLYWKGVKEDAISADIVSLSSKLAIDQSVLQASFQAFARINSLQLSDFLR